MNHKLRRASELALRGRLRRRAVLPRPDGRCNYHCAKFGVHYRRSGIMVKSLVLGCVILLELSAPAAARCTMPVIRAVDNQTVDGYMTVNSGAPCSIRLRSSSGPIFSAEIVQRPSNGSASVDGSNRVVYRSRSG